MSRHLTVVEPSTAPVAVKEQSIKDMLREIRDGQRALAEIVEAHGAELADTKAEVLNIGAAVGTRAPGLDLAEVVRSGKVTPVHRAQVAKATGMQRTIALLVLSHVDMSQRLKWRAVATNAATGVAASSGQWLPILLELFR